MPLHMFWTLSRFTCETDTGALFDEEEAVVMQWFDNIAMPLSIDFFEALVLLLVVDNLNVMLFKMNSEQHLLLGWAVVVTTAVVVIVVVVVVVFGVMSVDEVIVFVLMWVCVWLDFALFV